MRASGESGALRVGYQPAAALGTWTLTLEPRLPRSFVLRAKVLNEHAFWSKQRPMDLVLRLATVEWIWRGINFHKEGDEIVVELSEKPIVEEHRRIMTGVSRG